ncbi:MAG: glycosyltransferase family 4 protein [Candidatus Rokubacteria bacterium]|nr:glycosyltransferase family 4 protein [Candidatus Rokubacteria bacterium]
MTAGARVAVNACIIGEHPTGLGLYTIKLIRALDGLRDDLVVYTSAPATLDGLHAPVIPITPAVRPDLGLRGHVARALWLQTVQRMRCRARRFPVVLNTIPEAILDRQIPQVTVVHDLLPLSFPPEYPRQQHYFRHLVPRALRLSRRVIADSQSTRADVIRRFEIAPEKVTVVSPGYDPALYSPGDTGAGASVGPDPYLLYVGNLLPHKNLPRLLDAFAILRRRLQVRLVIRGEGWPAYTRSLYEQVETLGLAESVIFLEYADEETLRDLYQRAACLVLPSLGEGFGLPVLEAMACGLPVITSRVSSLAEVAGDAAVTVNPYDATELSDAMYRVLTDRDLREDLRRRGLERAGQFTWRQTAEHVSALLDEVVAGPSAFSATLGAPARYS